MVAPFQPRSPGTALRIYAQEYNTFLRGVRDGGAFLGDRGGAAAYIQVANNGTSAIGALDIVICPNADGPFRQPDDDNSEEAALSPPRLYVDYRDDEAWGLYTAYQVIEPMAENNDIGWAVRGLVWAKTDIQYAGDRYAIPITKDADDCTMQSHCYGYPILYRVGAEAGEDAYGPAYGPAYGAASAETGAQWALIDLSGPWEQGFRDGYVNATGTISSGEMTNINVPVPGESLTYHVVSAYFDDGGTGDDLEDDDQVTIAWAGDQNRWRIATWGCPTEGASPSPALGGAIEITSSSNTSISTASVWYDEAGAYTATLEALFDHPTNGELRFLDTGPETFTVTAKGFFQPEMADRTYQIGVDHYSASGGSWSLAFYEEYYPTSTSGKPFSFYGDVTMSQNDRLKIVVRNTDDAYDIWVTQAELRATL